MKRFEIYNAQVEWNHCRDLRPWMIVELRSNGLVAAFPIAGQCYGHHCFLIERNHPDFAATGLTKSCFVHDSHLFEIALSAIQKKRGALQGQLLRDFCDYAGLE